MLRLVGHHSGVFRPLADRTPAFEISGNLSFTYDFTGTLLFSLSTAGDLLITNNLYTTNVFASGFILASGAVPGQTSSILTDFFNIKTGFPLLNTSSTSDGDSGTIIQRHQLEWDPGGGWPADDLVSKDTPDDTGTATAGGAATLQLRVGSSASNDYYKGWWIWITGGTGAGNIRRILGYVGATRTITVNAWAAPTDATSAYSLFSNSYAINYFDHSDLTWRLCFAPETTALYGEIPWRNFASINLDGIMAEGEISTLSYFSGPQARLQEYLRIEETIPIPAAGANRGFLFTHDNAGITELYYEDSSGSVCRITDAGGVNAVAVIGNGTPALFWEVNNDAVAGSAEDPYIILSGGNGVADLYKSYFRQYESLGYTCYFTTKNGTEISPTFCIGDQLNSAVSLGSTLRFVGYDVGTAHKTDATFVLSNIAAVSILTGDCDILKFKCASSGYVLIDDVLDFDGRTTAGAPAVSNADESRSFYDETLDEQRISENTGAFVSYVVGTRQPTDFSASVTPDQYQNITVDGALTWDAANGYFVFVRTAGSGAGYMIVPFNPESARSTALKGMYLSSVVFYYRMQNTHATATLTCDVYSYTGSIEGTSPASAQKTLTYSLDAAGRKADGYHTLTMPLDVPFWLSGTYGNAIYVKLSFGGTGTETFHVYHTEFKFTAQAH